MSQDALPYTSGRPARVLLVAATTGYQTRMFGDAAEHVGVELVMATDRCHVLDDPWGDDAVPLRFGQPESAAAKLARLNPPPSGIVAVGDRPAYIAALAAEKLGIPWSPPSAVGACRNKAEARRRFAAAGLPVPRHFQARVEDGPDAAAQRAEYPCVLKPLGLSASRGVIRANDPREFRAAFERIAALLEAPDISRLRDEQDRFIQVESYIPGKEFAVEGLLTRGRLQVHAIFDKPDPLEGPFFEETVYVTPSRECEATQRLLIAAAERATRALGLTHGPVHAEMRLNDEGVWMLEVAARPIGGLCAKALRFAGGVSLEELILMHALGADVSGLRLEPEATGVMMIPIPKNGTYQGVTGVEGAAAVPGVTEVAITAKEGQTLLRLPEGNSYLGFLFARGESPAFVEAALREAHERLRFEIMTDLPVLRREPEPALPRN